MRLGREFRGDAADRAPVALWLAALLAMGAACARSGAAPAHSGPAPESAAPAVRDTVAEARQRTVRDSTEAFLKLRSGQLDLEGGRDSAAAGEFTEALRMSPRLTEALVELATVHARAGRFPLALALADSASALGDTSVYVTSLRGRLLAGTGRCPDAVAVLAPFLLAHPEWTTPAPDLVRCYLRLGRASDAVPVAQEAVRREPGAPPLEYALVDAFTAARQPDSALAHARSLTEHRPENGLWWVVMGRVLVLVNRLDEARAAFERGFRLRPGLADSLAPIDRNAWQAVESLRRKPPR